MNKISKMDIFFVYEDFNIRFEIGLWYSKNIEMIRFILSLARQAGHSQIKLFDNDGTFLYRLKFS